MLGDNNGNFEIVLDFFDQSLQHLNLFLENPGKIKNPGKS